MTDQVQDVVEETPEVKTVVVIIYSIGKSRFGEVAETMPIAFNIAKEQMLKEYVELSSPDGVKTTIPTEKITSVTLEYNQAKPE